VTTEYWHGTVLCHRKGFCHIGNQQCLEMYDFRLCGGCDAFCWIMERRDIVELEEDKKRDERKALAPVRKRREK